jgi:hypothetical protein
VQRAPQAGNLTGLRYIPLSAKDPKKKPDFKFACLAIIAITTVSPHKDIDIKQATRWWLLQNG